MLLLSAGLALVDSDGDDDNGDNVMCCTHVTGTGALIRIFMGKPDCDCVPPRQGRARFMVSFICERCKSDQHRIDW